MVLLMGSKACTDRCFRLEYRRDRHESICNFGSEQHEIDDGGISCLRIRTYEGPILGKWKL